jgi:ragB/susD domain protein
LAQDKTLEGNVNTVSDLRNLLNGAYNRMSQYEYYGRNYIIYGEVRSDNAFSSAATNRFVQTAEMKLNNTDNDPTDTWMRLFSTLAPVNIVINANRSAVSGNAATINHYVGEAYAIRAMIHFDALKLYGQQDVTGQGGMNALGVPYVTTFGTVGIPSRESAQVVYNKIQADLDTALSLMSASLNNTSSHYMTTNAVKALKARVALHFKDYVVAAQYAKEVIDSGSYSVASSSAFASTFNTDSTNNQIFSIANSVNDNIGNNSLANIYQGRYGDVQFLKDLYDKYEATDVRKSLLTSSGTNRYRMSKYVDAAYVGSYDIPVIRYEEVVLIYAEARLLGYSDSTNALTYLNQIASNRGASSYTSATLDNILLERRKEFAGEGFRFYDLVRTGRNLPLVDDNLQTYGQGRNRDQPVPYGSYNLAFPIPLGELRANPNMRQNYNY